MRSPVQCPRLQTLVQRRRAGHSGPWILDGSRLSSSRSCSIFNAICSADRPDTSPKRLEDKLFAICSIFSLIRSILSLTIRMSPVSQYWPSSETCRSEMYRFFMYFSNPTIHAWTSGEANCVLTAVKPDAVCRLYPEIPGGRCRHGGLPYAHCPGPSHGTLPSYSTRMGPAMPGTLPSHLHSVKCRQ